METLLVQNYYAENRSEIFSLISLIIIFNVGNIPNYSQVGKGR